MVSKQPESHTTEYKSSWRDEYLKIICAFANAEVSNKMKE